jgi:hypothetical protein
VPPERAAATILPCVYSMSWGRKRNFGDRAADFERDLAAALEKLQPSGRLHDHPRHRGDHRPEEGRLRD